MALLALLGQGVDWPQPQAQGEVGLLLGGPYLVLKEDRGHPLLSPSLPPQRPLALLFSTPLPSPLRPPPSPPPGRRLHLLYARLQMDGG
ncbi:hypothetical protein YIM1640_01670 [Thermus oshimai]|uniref:Uncharacterized protein n=1 Tax=Thermus oshimai JL-2 TaxID=751945 RepID=K7QX12_THEOS|nr:hypothetical protein [Thermus oshimai]AFV76213.1 hypothetical protein Theos_1171 [Thermus oshimai JL-2]